MWWGRVLAELGDLETSCWLDKGYRWQDVFSYSVLIEYIEKGGKASYCLKISLYNSLLVCTYLLVFLPVFFWSWEHSLLIDINSGKIIYLFILNHLWLCHAISRPLYASYKSTFPSMIFMNSRSWHSICNWMHVGLVS